MNDCLPDRHDEISSELMSCLKQITLKKRCLLMNRLSCIKLGRTELGSRRRRMIRELRDILPIMEFNGKFSICEILLPDSSSLKGHDDNMISVAVGYVTLLLVELSEIIDLTLRFPLKFFGSKSSIFCTRKEKLFPLHVESSKSREHFDYAMALLNLNILQIRTLYGLTTEHPEDTLKNLFGLLNDLDIILAC